MMGTGGTPQNEAGMEALSQRENALTEYRDTEAAYLRERHNDRGGNDG